MDQGIGTFNGITLLGAEFTHSRGVSPSTGLMLLEPRPGFDRQVGALTLSYGGQSISLSDVSVATCPLQIHEGDPGFLWNAVAQDQRWLWRYPRISGRYNRRLCDGSIDLKGKKNARELAELLATELGSTIDVDNFPTTVYPAIVWEEALARYELAWLCDLFAMTVCPKVDNSFRLEPITATASLPSGGEYMTPPTYSYKSGIMPSDVEVRGSHDWKQGWVPLQAIGLDADGKQQLLGSVSYNPGAQWPHVFRDVADASRHLAFQTAYRRYTPVDPTIVLGDRALEVGLDVPADQVRCLPPQVRGAFMSHDDFGTTTDPAAIYTGEFRVLPHVVEFDYPVYKVIGGMAPADLQINTSYYHVDSDGNPATAYKKASAVSQSVIPTKPRAVHRPELSKREIVDTLYGGVAGDNTAQLDAEATVILQSVVGGYAYAKAHDVLYDRLVFPDTTAGIAQILWRCGNQRPATTRIGVNAEIHIQAMGHQQRRALERLSQMAERLGV